MKIYFKNLGDHNLSCKKEICPLIRKESTFSRYDLISKILFSQNFIPFYQGGYRILTYFRNKDDSLY